MIVCYVTMYNYVKLLMSTYLLHSGNIKECILIAETNFSNIITNNTFNILNISDYYDISF